LKKNKSNFRIDIIIIFAILLLGPATGLLLSKTNLLDKIEFLNILRPNADVYDFFFFRFKHYIIFISNTMTIACNTNIMISLLCFKQA
jgi:hypothetical protein